jgi:hypothetical protein
MKTGSSGWSGLFCLFGWVGSSDEFHSTKQTRQTKLTK